MYSKYDYKLHACGYSEKWRYEREGYTNSIEIEKLNFPIKLF